MLLETGFLGTVTYLILPIYIASGVLRSPRVIRDPSLVLQVASCVVIAVVFWVGAFYTQPWWSPALSVSFWTFAGLTWTNVRKLGKA